MKKLSDNERLEFLGDAVLEVVSSEFLYKEHTDLPEGDLTKLRASIVCEPTLALCTREIDLGKYLYLGKGENLTGGRGRKSILSDALEAVIGAIYLDGGFEPAKAFIHRFILTDIEHKKLFYDRGKGLGLGFFTTLASTARRGRSGSATRSMSARWIILRRACRRRFGWEIFRRRLPLRGIMEGFRILMGI